MAGEAAWTRRLATFFGSAPQVAVGIGDDGAVLKTGPRTVAACDPVVEGVHFTPADPLGWVGHKAVHRNLSDLAAMGARPLALLVSLVLPKTLGGRRRSQLLGGLRRAAEGARCPVVGGDVVVHEGPLVVTVTALGTPIGGRVLRRNGARPGDTVHATGPCGGSRLGRHLRFTAPLAAGARLAGLAGTGAVIDVSDGLALDLHRIARASGGCGAVIVAEAVPIARAARRQARVSGRTPLDHALGDGEDHVLLFTWRGPRLPTGLGPTAVQPLGRIVAGPGLFLETDGRRRPLQPRGFEHDL